MTDSKVELVEKLLALSNDPGASEAERENALNKATALMAKYAIDDAMLHTSNKDAPSDIIEHHITLSGVYAKEQSLMSSQIARALGLRTYTSKSFMCDDLLLYYVGFKDEVHRTTHLLRILTASMFEELTRWWKTYEGKKYMTANERYKCRRSFISGFGSRVADRLRARVRDEVASHSDTTGVELAIVNRDQKINNWMSENVGPLRQVKSRRHVDLEGFVNGSRAGLHTNLGDTEINS